MSLISRHLLDDRLDSGIDHRRRAHGYGGAYAPTGTSVSKMTGRAAPCPSTGSVPRSKAAGGIDMLTAPLPNQSPDSSVLCAIRVSAT